MKGNIMKHLFQAIGIIAVCLILSFTVAAQRRSSSSRSRHKPMQRKSTHAKQNLAVKPPAEYVPVLKYDPARNADQDIKDGVAEAKRTGKRVFLEVGGQWCIWCHIMDEYFEKHPDLLAFREKNFVMVKINFSDENKNEQVLSRYPKVAGYPHIFVLDTDGKLLHSQDTGQLEEGRGYNLDKFMAFLKEWALPA
jgi:thiol:disulfide interchange protein